MALSPTGSRGGAGAVTTVFTRSGDVVAATSDYTDAQVANSPTNKLTTTGDTLYASAANTLARLAVGATGQVPTVVAGIPAYANPKPFQLGYAEATSNVTISSTTPASPTTIVSLGAVTYDGTACWFEFGCAGLNSPSGPKTMTVVLVVDGTVLRKIVELNGQTANSQSVGTSVRTKYTPSAGSHTILAAAYMDVGSGLAQAGNGASAAFMPAYLLATPG